MPSYALIFSIMTGPHAGWSGHVDDYDQALACERARVYAMNYWAEQHRGQTTRYPQFAAECVPIIYDAEEE